MRTSGRFVLSLFLVVGALLASGPAGAAVSNSTGTNVQQGNNNATSNQGGKGKSGDAVGGQVTGVVSSGRASVDARNTSSNSDVTSGDVHGSNTSSSFTGQNAAAGTGIGAGTTDITGSAATNLQDGSNRFTNTQTASYTTGDGVAGEVIGVVTAAGGSASIVAANDTRDSSVQTGDIHGANDVAAFVGQNSSFCVEECGTGLTVAADITASCSVAFECVNVQDGSNRGSSRQSSMATTGDGVAGQVIGAVSAGATSIDARNSSSGVDVTTGDVNALDNNASLVAGQNDALCIFFCGAANNVGPLASDISGVNATNVQNGDNRVTANQSASAATGDGVAGQVIGGVTAAGGSLSVVAANDSSDSSVQTGDAGGSNDLAAFAGQNSVACLFDCGAESSVSADVTNSCNGLIFGCANIQDGSNRATASQSVNATTGDGVAGQVLGAVSAGATSIDARNTSARVDVTTGDADAHNTTDAFVGQNFSACFFECDAGTGIGTAVDVSSVTAINLQNGANRGTFRQAATASSGDGVAGEVIGAVTSAGGSASIVAANSSTDSDVTTGDAASANDLAGFVGQNHVVCGADCGADFVVADVANSTARNLQDGSNRFTASQTATSATGDGVAGQVLGVVSAGAASIDATNRTADSSVTTGDANATNDLAAFVGQNVNACDVACDAGTVIGSDVTNSSCAPGPFGCNIQDGNNTKTFNQSADASSGDGVAGQVSGVVTSAGGSASVVLANTSSGIDSVTGDGHFDNSAQDFVGQNVSTFLSIGAGFVGIPISG